MLPTFRVSFECSPTVFAEVVSLLNDDISSLTKLSVTTVNQEEEDLEDYPRAVRAYGPRSARAKSISPDYLANSGIAQLMLKKLKEAGTPLDRDAFAELLEVNGYSPNSVTASMSTMTRLGAIERFRDGKCVITQFGIDSIIDDEN